MKAHVMNETSNTENHYCYFMTINMGNKYDVAMEGHLNGSQGHYEISTDMDYKNKQKSVVGFEADHSECNKKCYFDHSTCYIQIFFSKQTCLGCMKAPQKSLLE